MRISAVRDFHFVDYSESIGLLSISKTNKMEADQRCARCVFGVNGFRSTDYIRSLTVARLRVVNKSNGKRQSAKSTIPSVTNDWSTDAIYYSLSLSLFDLAVCICLPIESATWSNLADSLLSQLDVNLPFKLGHQEADTSDVRKQLGHLRLRNEYVARIFTAFSGPIVDGFRRCFYHAIQSDVGTERTANQLIVNLNYRVDCKKKSGIGR